MTEAALLALAAIVVIAPHCRKREAYIWALVFLAVAFWQVLR